MATRRQPEQGQGVDSQGNPVVDPSENVKALNEAGHKRQDDLWEMRALYIGAEIRRMEEVVKRVEQVSRKDADHAREIGLIHQTHDREIHKMEQEKLAAFRASDESARLTEAERTLAAVQLVARTAETTANDIRAVLNTTATTLADANAARDVENNKRIAALEKSMYEGAGKGTGAKNTVTYAIIAVGLLVSLITIGSVVVAIAFAIRR